MRPHKLNIHCSSLAAGAARRITRASGQAGQAGFEQHLGEARRAAARVPAASVSALPDPFHPYLSQADLSLTHAAVQADAEPVHLSVLAIDPDELQRTPEHPPFSPLRFDQDPRESFPPLSWRHDSQQAADELMAALPSFRSGEEVLANGLHNTGELRSTKRQRTLNNLHHAVSERQPSEIGNSGARVPMQPPPIRWVHRNGRRNS